MKMDGKTIHICDVETIAHDEAFEKVLKGPTSAERDPRPDRPPSSRQVVHLRNRRAREACGARDAGVAMSCDFEGTSAFGFEEMWILQPSAFAAPSASPVRMMSIRTVSG
jgi:hypothetical protein